ncbi:MAG: hypothetical protein RBJ76_24045 [Stenomitos frigidus ULC029]
MTLVLLAIGLLRSTSQPTVDIATPNMLALIDPLQQPPLLPSAPSVSTPDAAEALLDRPLQPTAPAKGTLKHQLSLGKSIDRVKQIDQTLSQLHPPPKNQAASGARAAAGGNSGNLAIQTLTMRQRLGSITGTLKKQDYEIKKLSFELAQKQFQDNEISKARLDQQQASYQKSARDLKTFLNSSRIAD